MATLSTEAGTTNRGNEMVAVGSDGTDYKQPCQVQALHFTAGWSYTRIATAPQPTPTTVCCICHLLETP
jgi:hypothetical protein